MKNNLTLSRAQARALTRLIQSQLQAYDEATRNVEEDCWATAANPNVDAPFTANDLDLVEPLVALLQKIAPK